MFNGLTKQNQTYFLKCGSFSTEWLKRHQYNLLVIKNVIIRIGLIEVIYGINGGNNIVLIGVIHVQAIYGHLSIAILNWATSEVPVCSRFCLTSS